MSKSAAFMSMPEGSDTGSSSAGTSAPVTTVEVDEQTGLQTETTTLYSNVDLPPDDNNADVSRLILEDCLKNIDRQETSLANLMRIYKKQKQATTVLKLSLQKAKKKERRQQRKADTLKTACKLLADKLPQIAKGYRYDNETDVDKSPDARDIERQQQQSPKEATPVQQMIGRVRDKIADMRHECKDIDERYNQLKTRMDEAKRKENDENFDAALSKLASQIDAIKAELTNLLRTLKKSLLLVASRLNKNYEIKEDPEAYSDVRTVLDNLLTDVKYLLRERGQTKEEADGLRYEIDQLMIQTRAAENSHDALIEDAKKLLKIGNKESARHIDPSKFDDVSKIVETVFDDLLGSIDGQNKRMGELRNAMDNVNRKVRREQGEFEREKTAKTEQCKRLADEIDVAKRKNKKLRDDLERSPASPVASCSDPADVEEHLRQMIGQQKAKDKQREKDEAQRVAKALERKNAVQQNLKTLPGKIADVDDGLEKKRKELKELENALARDRDDGKRRIGAFGDESERRRGKVDALERQLDDLLDKAGRKDWLKTALTETTDYGRRLAEKIQNLDADLSRANADREKLAARLKKADDDGDRLRNQVMDEENRRQNLEKKLDDIQDEIDKADKKLDRERQRNLQNERTRLNLATMQQQFQFQQTTCTTITSGVPSSAVQNCSVSSLNQPTPVQKKESAVGGTNEVGSIISDSSDTQSFDDKNRPY